ncbi:MerR family transcriptional regulator [Microlunatus aurantiacus]|uniref:MerR family transcriptional regulator n=1 Tax=Microlunatus aurantiacus TaxID=446786 RepID=A0ABP7EIN1_9ACTN
METPLTSLAQLATGESGDDADAVEPRYQIGAVAERTSLSHHTLRHWDEAGLVSPSGRSDGGFRLYSDADIERILVIRRMKPLGFTLEQMQQLLDAIDTLRAPTSDAEARARSAATLKACAQQAHESLERIRRHLGYAEEFSDLISGWIRATDT